MRKFFFTLAIVLCWSVSLASAQSNWHVYDFFNLNGGLADGLDPTALQPNEASDLQNIVFTTGGAVKKRVGSSRINTTAISATTNFNGGTFFKLSSGTRFLVSVTDNGTTGAIRSMAYGTGTSGPNGTWTDRTGTLVFAITADNEADFAAAQDSLVIEDGLNTTAPYVWTGSGNATALGGSPPNATMVEYHKNILFSAGSSGFPSRVYFSNIGDIATWTSTDFFNVETNDGQIVRALKSALDCLYIFKDTSIWRACGTNRDDLTVEQMVRGVGTLSNNSVAVIDNRFIFLDSVGHIIQYDGGINYKILSYRINGTMGSVNLNRVNQAVAGVLDEGTGRLNYYLSLSNAGSGTNNLIMVYDTLQNAFTKFTGLSCNALWDYEVGTFLKALACGDYSGFASRYPDTTVNSDAGTAINAYYQSGWLRFADIPTEKMFRLLHVFLTQTGNYTVNFLVNTDFGTTGTTTVISLAGSGATWDSATFDSSLYADLTTTTGRIELTNNPAGTDFLQYRISDNSSNPAFTMKGVRIWVEPTGRIGGVQ